MNPNIYEQEEYIILCYSLYFVWYIKGFDVKFVQRYLLFEVSMTNAPPPPSSPFLIFIVSFFLFRPVQYKAADCNTFFLNICMHHICLKLRILGRVWILGCTIRIWVSIYNVNSLLIHAWISKHNWSRTILIICKCFSLVLCRKMMEKYLDF